MSEHTPVNVISQSAEVLPTRDQIRSKIFASKKLARKEIIFFGQKIEIQQPTLEDIMTAQVSEDRDQAVINQLVKYSFVPGTNDRVFEDTDAESFKHMPFTNDFVAVSKALEALSEVNFRDGKASSGDIQPA